MRLLKDGKKGFHEYEFVVINACEKGKKDVSLHDLFDKFIAYHLTENEMVDIDMYTHQIGSLIDQIYEDKTRMLNDISFSYGLFAQSKTLSTERAKIYMRALERIEKEYGNELYNYLLNYKNL
jgi:hypothetical protein